MGGGRSRLVWLLAVVLAVTAVRSSRADEAAEGAATEQPEAEAEVVYLPPDNVDPATVYFADHFDHQDKFGLRWMKSMAKKEGAEAGIDQ